MANVMRALPALLKNLGFTPTELVHVGAHEGQEVPIYYEAGIPNLTLVEPIPALAARLRDKHPDAIVHECACGAAPGREQLHVMARSNLSTLAAPQRGDRVTETIEVDVRRLDEIAPHADAAAIDAQGRELDVLAAAPWQSLRLVVVETCTVADSTMASPYKDVVELMQAHDFREVDRWARDYDWLNRWARGPGQAPRGGEVRDVVFYREPV
ncbi:FkbM family methyltransferase [Streptomyces caniscabiei]|uniref:FkbM family methyltransferase n=1 Tax=Streptomyces caniscabiei TaxID=2746961 RepID=UPI001872F974|nr:FkbM family methyltransferase [Streptomyces caniscabiei]MBE4783914.1 FkbM family methyltransferase [Streptomyces caniscabiei]MBE4791587.1 FkbM family methyltransferase [Streptomyces caniscabiei]MDX3009176.1 FkbM family methyltransferase [Streptomyces caniscabiei]